MQTSSKGIVVLTTNAQKECARKVRARVRSLRAVSSAAVATVMVLGALTAGAAEQRQWQTGVLLHVDSQMMAKTGFLKPPYPVERRYYTIDPGAQSELVYILIQEEKNAKDLAMLTVNQSVRFAFDGEVVYVMDERKREKKMKIFSKVARTREATPAATASSAASSPAHKSGDIKRGMTPAEVEEALGKPLRTVGFERKKQWMYQGVTVVFEDDHVVDVTF
jgi:hypothetical protein